MVLGFDWLVVCCLVGFSGGCYLLVVVLMLISWLGVCCGWFGYDWFGWGGLSLVLLGWLPFVVFCCLLEM